MGLNEFADKVRYICRTMSEYRMANGFAFTIYDRKLERPICHCNKQADAANICVAMNRMEMETLKELQPNLFKEK